MVNQQIAFPGESITKSMFEDTNFTPVVREGYRVGVPGPGYYEEILNSDADIYGGSNAGNFGGMHAEPVEWQGKPYSIMMRLPPLATVGFRHRKK